MATGDGSGGGFDNTDGFVTNKRSIKSKRRFTDLYLIWLEVIIWISFSLQLVLAYAAYQKGNGLVGSYWILYSLISTFIALGFKALLIVLIQIRDK